MRKALLVAVALILCLSLLGPMPVQKAEASDWLNLEQLNQGVIGVRYEVRADVKTKLLISKGADKYTYTLRAGVAEESFPLQLGNGDYTIAVLEQISGTSYQVVQQASVALELADPNAVYLASVQNVNWAEAAEAVQMAKELTAELKNDEEKAQAVYDYIVNHIQYDYDLAATVGSDYMPDPDRTLTNQKDICYGFSSLFAAMLRSIGIPTKLAMGTSSYVDVYHAWNEVYLSGRWVTVDTTVDAGWKANGQAFEMVKDASRYVISKVY
jgi:transglutaminase-like putative cysteine protease